MYQALLVSPIVRPVTGLSPMALINKPKRGTGATLLAKLVTVVAFGSATDLTTAPSDNEEWRKKITASLLGGVSVIFFDNVDNTLTSPHLSAVLTAELWNDRILGRSEMARDLPNRATWIATGNNLQVGGDVGRRCYLIRVDAKMERPWTRTTFRYPDLLGHVQAHRRAILHAPLTIARGWFAAGKPLASEVPTLGSFERWTQVLGGMLANINVEGFLQNLSTLYESIDEGDSAWEAFLAGWHATFGDAPTTVADVCATLKKTETSPVKEAVHPDLLDALAGKGKVTPERKLGWLLRKHDGAIFGAYMLGRDGKQHQAIRWLVRRGESGSQGSQFGAEASLGAPGSDGSQGSQSGAEAPPGAPYAVPETGQRPPTDCPDSPDSPPPAWRCAWCRSTTRFDRGDHMVCGGCHAVIAREAREPGAEG